MCVDIEYDTLLIDRKFLMQKIFDYRIHIRLNSKFFKIRDINNIVVITIDYISLIFRIFEIAINDKNTIVLKAMR